MRTTTGEPPRHVTQATNQRQLPASCPKRRCFELLAAFSGILLATPLGSSAQIKVGPNVHVSGSRPKLVLNEVLMNADPSNGNRLIACAVGNDPEYASTSLPGRAMGSKYHANAFMSDDGGKTWRFATELLSKNEFGGLDNHCAFGVNGEAFLIIAIGDPRLRDTADKSEFPRGRNPLYFRRSTDGGKTWSQDIELPESEGIDRQYIIADDTHSKYRGRVYITGHTSVTNLDNEPLGVTALTLWHSTDGGVTWGRPIKTLPKKLTGIFNPWAPVILDDGAVVFPWWDQSIATRTPRGDYSSIPMGILFSEDGGESFSKSYKVADIHRFNPPYTVMLDRSNGPFKGRLYAAYPDPVNGRDQMLITHSDDRGKTWSKPVVVNDDRAAIDTSKGPDIAIPVIAVNKDGVVGAMWYDRRDHPDNKGWWVRFGASLDGGDTWLPSVRVSTAPKSYIEGEQTTTQGSASLVKSGNDKISRISISKSEWAEGGHTSGLVGDASGRFQAVWVDDRTGLHQMWGAPITVEGTVAKNGGGELASYTDVSAKAQVMLVATNYNERANRVTATIRLKNISKDTLRGPMKVRLLSVSSDVGVVQASNAENGVRGQGAVWTIPVDVLLPDQESSDKQLIFSLSDARSFKDLGDRRGNILTFEMKVLRK
jgi:hypothetical protein